MIFLFLWFKVMERMENPMRKFWLIAKQEYLKRAKKRSFLLGTLLIPVLFAIIIGVTIFIIERDKNTLPFGYVDNSGVLEKGLLPELDEREEMIEMRAYPNQDAAMAALEAGEIQAFHVIPGNFLKTLKVDLYYWDEYPDNGTLRDFNDYVRANLLPDGPNDIQTRIIEGADLTLVSIDGKRKFNENIGFVAVLFPLAVAMFFIFAVMGASGYFLQAITDEKENRTMEIAITSVSPWQLIAGKSLGLLSIALTQISIWLLSIAIAWMIAYQVFEELQGIELPWDILLVFVAFFIPSFALVGGMMAAIGGAVTELQEGQQISGILNLFFTFPLFLTALVFANPNSPFLVFMSFFPTTSFLTITLRWGLTIIPFWQLAISWLILVFSGAFTLWIASRIFRIGMLRYGQRMSFRSVVEAIRPTRLADNS
jgi:ABC-2 type transport system permease protein